MHSFGRTERIIFCGLDRPQDLFCYFGLQRSSISYHVIGVSIAIMLHCFLTAQDYRDTVHWEHNEVVS